MRYKANHFSIQEFTIHQKRHIWYSVVVILCCLVVFCTAYALIYPALTMSKDCELIEHTHTSELCYSYQKPEAVSIICTDEAMGVHKHTDECKDNNDELICGYADFVVHSHNEFCFDTNGELICTIPELKEHIHEDACYTKVDNEDPILICEEKEVTLHTHIEDCFDSDNLVICGKAEILEHIHTEACRQISVGEEELILTCTQEEHTHTPECSSKKSTETTIETTITPTTESTTPPAPLYAVQPAAEIFGKLVEKGNCNDYITWAYYDNGVFIISGTGAIPDYTADNTPWSAHKSSITKVTINEGITSIGRYAFQNCTNLTVVELPSTLTAIGDYAFQYCTSILTINLPDSLTNLGQHAFNSCSNLTEMDLSNTSLTRIGNQAFQDCTNLTNVYFPDNLIFLGEYTFWNCTSLTIADLSATKIISVPYRTYLNCSSLHTVILPETVTIISNATFQGCTSLANINFPEGLTTLLAHAFANCISLTSLDLPNSLTSCGVSVFQGCTGLTYVDLSNTNQTSVGQGMFSNCTNLVSVTLSEKITIIESSAFNGCSKLTDINLPAGLTEIQQAAFQNCSSFTFFDLSHTEITTLGNSVFWGCNITSITFPDTLTTIGNNTFSYCNKLTTIDFSNTCVISMGNSVFYGSGNINSITLSDTLLSVGYRAFTGPKITSMELPDSLVVIGTNAFENSKTLEFVNLPVSLERIEATAFSGCSGLIDVTLETPSLSSVASDAFLSATIQNLIIADSVEVLHSDFISSAKPNSITFASNSEFAYEGSNFSILNNGQVITLSDGVIYTVDEDGVIVEAKNTFPDTDVSWQVKDGVLTISGTGEIPDFSISNPAPWHASAPLVTKVVIEDGITSIGNYSFKDYTNITEISIPKSIASIGDGAFQNCTGLTEVNIENANLDFGNGVFYNCSSLSKVNSLNTLEAVMEAFNLSDKGIFYNTVLWENYFGEENHITDKFKTTDSTGRSLSLTTTQAGRTLLTGETSDTTLIIDKGVEDQTDYTRIFFAFSGDGHINFPEGEYTLDNGIEIIVRLSDTPNVYYVEVQPLSAGDTLDLVINSLYSNVITSGGTVDVWMDVLSEAEREALGNGITIPEETHRVTWTTNPAEFPVTKTTSGNKSVLGDGTEGVAPAVNKLSYTIKMLRVNQDTSLGTDPMLRAEFVDRLTLSEEFTWADGLIDAIEAGNYYWDGTSIYVNVNDEDLQLCSLSNIGSQTFAWPSIETDSSGNKTILINWLYQNSDISTQINSMDTTLTFGNMVICVKDVDDLSEKLVNNNLKPLKLIFHNEINCTQYFTYSDIQTQSASCDTTVEVRSANIIVQKHGSSTIYLGDAANYTFNISNTGSFPNTSLTRVQDPLMNYFYIHPEQMQTMFDTERDGPLLTITINDAVLYKEVIRKNIKDINGNDYIITQQDMGTNTPHIHYASDTTADDPYIRSSEATLSITWAQDQSHLILTVDANDGTAASNYSIGENCDFATIQDALDGVGYLVTTNDHYTIEWNMTEETLYSGETRTFTMLVCAKNSLMLLTGDQPWFIKNSATFQDSVSNIAYAYTQTGNQAESTHGSGANRKIMRDYTLYKSVYNINDLNAEATEAESGDVLKYCIDLDYSGKADSAAYNGAPLVDHMRGAQILLVSVEDNPHLAEYNFGKHSLNGEYYYLLNKEGTYNNVKIGEYLADHIDIAKSDVGLSTMIYWYLSSAQSCDVDFYALVDLEKAIQDANNADTISFSLENEVWLNDHQTHRLYDQVGLEGTRLFIHKFVIENFPEEELNIKNCEYHAHNVNADIPLDRSTVHEGENVTYRLHLDGRGTGDVVVKGSKMYDVLPENTTNYWSKENIQLFYMVGAGSAGVFTCTDGSEWYIDTDSEGKQFIRWNDDFEISMNGDVYIYVTLTFPTGQAWSDYAHIYGNFGLRNSFHVIQLQDEVFHDLGVTGKAVLQKGVLNTGFYKNNNFYEEYYNKNTDTAALSTYANDSTNSELVTYYVTLYNSGDTRLYLSEIQDVLPKGFTLRGLKKASKGFVTTSENTSSYEDLINITNENNESVTFKSAYIEATSTKLDDGKTRVIFNIYNNLETDNLSYDTDVKKYYLNSNEAIVFAYHCSTNKYADTEDLADNNVAMPIFDYNGSGVSVDQTSIIDRAKSEDLISNNGSRDICDNQQASSDKMDTTNTDDFTKWLSSEVRVRRGNIVPGITKTSDVSFSGVYDSINWTVKVTNNGTTSMHAYTITDVMMNPYQFIGDVSYKVTDRSGNDLVCNLFEFGERSEDDSTVTLITRTENITLEINGEPKPISHQVSVNGASTTINPLIGLTTDEAGNEILTIEFPEKDYKATGISPGCIGTLTLTTKNTTSSARNKAYVNTAYISPVQEYERRMVTRGSNTLLEESPSVVSEANVAVSYGYATAANKSVTEANTTNTAQSNNTTNYIVLSDKFNTFRYDLTVNNTGGTATSQAMDMLVLIDNLPEVGDHLTFYEDIERYSEFGVKFADDPQVVVKVNDRVLEPSDYTIEYSSATTFTDADWSGLESETQWNSECSDSMRSLRMIIKDDEGKIIPANADITISFNAKVAEPTTALPSQVAWNSFGYRYSLTSSASELEAAPSKVGVKISSIPTLSKKLIDSNGNDYSAVADESFRFLIYQQKAQNFSSFDIATVTEELTSKDIPFTIADISVAKGSNESETINLDSLNLWELNEDGDLVETSTKWIWNDLESYSIIELLPENSIYVFGTLNDINVNNQTFIYQAALPTSLSGTNIRNLWSLQLLKQDVNNQKPLEGSVFALYSKLENDKISTDNYEALSSEYGLTPDKTVTTTAEGGLITTWYLMDVKSSNAQGEILWANLTEKEYYVVELKAPNGYKLNPEGELVESTESGTGIKTVIVTNSPGYKLPLTGGFGTTGVYILGILMLGFAAALLPILRRKTSSQN